jgi:polyhydroxyalkanoate synthesis regulator phasin
MPRDERFKKYQEAGADFLETARARAEEFLRELAKATDTTQKQGRDTLDDLVEGSRKGTEQFISSIRKEITTQLSALGIATRDDLAALERRITGKATAQKSAPSKSAPSKSAPSKSAGATKKATASKSSSTSKSSSATKKSTSSARKSTAKKTSASKSPAAKKTTGTS